MHLGPFGCLTKLSAKWAELVQKFVPWSHVLIFHNKHTWLATLGSKVMFWYISYYLGAFGTVWLPYKIGSKTAWSGVEVRALKSCQNFSQQTIRCTPLDPNLIFLCISYYFYAFGRVWLRYNTQCKMGQPGAKVRAKKSCRNFSQRTHPIHPIGPLPHVSVNFIFFVCIWDSLLHYNTQFKTGQTWAKVRATKSHLNFSQQKHPIHPIGL
jgi:hypothetical protein